MGTDGARRAARKMRELDKEVSSKTAKPSSSNQASQGPAQRLQAAKPPTAKQWQSLVISAEIQSGLAATRVAREPGRNDTQDPVDGGPRLPCRQNYGAWMSLLFAALECNCRNCQLAIKCAGIGYEHWLDATGKRKS